MHSKQAKSYLLRLWLKIATSQHSIPAVAFSHALDLFPEMLKFAPFSSITECGVPVVKPTNVFEGRSLDSVSDFRLTLNYFPPPDSPSSSLDPQSRLRG